MANDGGHSQWSTTSTALGNPAKILGPPSQTMFQQDTEIEQNTELSILPTQSRCYMPHVFLLRDRSRPVARVIVLIFFPVFPRLKATRQHENLQPGQSFLPEEIGWAPGRWQSLHSAFGEKRTAQLQFALDCCWSDRELIRTG